MGRAICYWIQKRADERWENVSRIRQGDEPEIYFAGKRDEPFLSLLMAGPARGLPENFPSAVYRGDSFVSWLSVAELEQSLLAELPHVLLDQREFVEWTWGAPLPPGAEVKPPFPAHWISPSEMQSRITRGLPDEGLVTGVELTQKYAYRHVWGSLPWLRTLGSPDGVRLVYKIRTRNASGASQQDHATQ